MNVAHFPAGWYRDPSERHEQRYWDGLHWGPQVLDHGYASDDPGGAAPAPTSIAWQGSAVGTGYRAVRVSAWRLAALSIGSILAVLALLFEIMAAVVIYGMSFRPDGDWLFLWSWLYREADSYAGITYVGYPPAGIYLALVLSLIFLSGVTIRQESALKKAGAQGSRIWSPAPEKYAWTVAVARLRAQTGGRYFNTIMRPHHRVFLLLQMVAAAAVVLMSYLAIWEQTAIGAVGTALPVNLSVGLGPWLCLVAGVALAVGAILAWPLTRHEIIIRPDGTIEPLT